MTSGAAFVGRQQELADLTAALRQPRSLVLIEGEAGIGKSRLVQEVLAAPGVSGRRVLAASCPPLHEPFPLGPLVDALQRAHPRLRELRLSALGGALRPLFPEWSADLPDLPDALHDPGATRHRLLRAMTELVDELGVDLLVLEDAHWADTSTLDLLLLLTAPTTRDLGVVVTYRPTDVPAGSMLRRLTSRPAAQARQLRVLLAPFGVDDTARLVGALFGTEQVSAEFVQLLHERTEGVPLAVEESVSLLRDRGDIVRRGDEWTRRALADLQVPPTVRDSVLERVARLGPEAQTLLDAAAVLAEPADEALLTRVTGQDEDATRRGLRDALGSGLLLETGPGQYGFRHVLACRAVAEALPASERRRLHRRSAEGLQEMHPQPVNRLNRHFREAGEVGSWSRYAEAGADLALESGDDHTAVVLLHEVLTKAVHPPPVHARLARKLGEAATWGAAALGDLGSSVAGALSDSLSRGDLPAAERGEIRLLLGRLLQQLGEFDAAAAQTEAAVSDLTDRPALAARAMVSLAFPRGQTWSAARHLEWLERASELAPRLSDRADRTWLTVDRISALLFLGQEAGWQAAAELDVVAPTLDEQRQLARCRMNVGHLAIAWGRYRDAAVRLESAVQLMQETGYQRLLNSARLTQAFLDWHTGRWDGLADRVTELADVDDTLPEARLEARQVLGLLALARGERGTAEDELRSVLAEAQRRGLLDAQMSPAATLGRLCRLDGRVGDALAVTTPGVDLIVRKQMWLWCTDIAVAHVEALCAGGRTVAADELVTTLAAGLGDRAAPAPAAALAECRAIVADAQGLRREATAGFAHATRAWAALPRPYDELRAAERQAGSLLDCGDRECGLELLASVQERLQGLGARWDADRVARVLRRHGVEVTRVWRGGRRGYGDQLSPRELEVTRLVADGLTNRQVAETLFLSPRTVDRHLSNAMHKLQVSSRTALAVAATDAGLRHAER